MKSFNLLTSFLFGFTCFILLFLFCAFLVIGIKAVYIYIKRKYFKTVSPSPKKRRKPATKPIKSIEINPDEVEQIFVKKS